VEGVMAVWTGGAKPEDADLCTSLPGDSMFVGRHHFWRRQLSVCLQQVFHQRQVYRVRDRGQHDLCRKSVPDPDHPGPHQELNLRRHDPSHHSGSGQRRCGKISCQPKTIKGDMWRRSPERGGGAGRQSLRGGACLDTVRSTAGARSFGIH
jgi:hypothetical protein